MSRFDGIQRHLAANDLWCFPLRVTTAGKKRPLAPWKDLQVRPPTDDELADWNWRFPNAGAGIPTGPATGICLVDTDNADATEWCDRRGMPETVRVHSYRGFHYYLKYPPGIRVRNSQSKLAPKVDICGSGGVATAVGTPRPNGFVYYYDEGHALGEVAIADPPDWLIEWLMQEESRRQTAVVPLRPQIFDGKIGAWARTIIDAELAKVAGASEGTRNGALTRGSFKLGQLAGGGEAEVGELRAALYAIADCWPNRSHSRDTIDRSFEAGCARPRQAPPLKFKRRNRWAYVPGLAGEVDG